MDSTQYGNELLQNYFKFKYKHKSLFDLKNSHSHIVCISIKYSIYIETFRKESESELCEISFTKIF